jgi:hypothetical protein
MYLFSPALLYYAMYSMQEIYNVHVILAKCVSVCLYVRPVVTTLASAILSRSSPNFARCFGTRIVRMDSLGIKIGQHLPVLSACAENLQMQKIDIQEQYPQNRVFSQDFAYILCRLSGMPDRMAWSDLIPEVVFWPFLRLRSKNMAQNPPKIAFLAKISCLFRY